MSWQLFDYVQRLAAFGSKDELLEVVNSPESFIQHRKALVIVMSDQIPFYLKIQPGKQLYAHWETQNSKKDRNKPNVLMGSAGQSRSVSALELPEDDIDQTEGMTQKRGEATENNDKYRITVDVEQVLRNWFDEDLVPKAGWGHRERGIRGRPFSDEERNP